jgi:hypothetical protein
MKRLVVLQPGKLGDLIVTSPIIQHYSDEYKIEWLVFETFKSFFNSIENVEIVGFNIDFNRDLYFKNPKNRLNFTDNSSLNSSLLFFQKAEEYIINTKPDLFLDVCWGFPGSSQKNNNMISYFNSQKRNWIDMRYSLANVPLSKRWDFKWKRNEQKEDKLLKFVELFSEKKYGSKNYSIIHSYKGAKEINLENPIDFSYIQGYEIYDWYKVLLNSKSIACVDSSLCNFVEVLPELREHKKYYLGSEELHYYDYMRNILLNNWLDNSNTPIFSDYLGKI